MALAPFSRASSTTTCVKSFVRSTVGLELLARCGKEGAWSRSTVFRVIVNISYLLDYDE